ncbi:hypothetical protein BD770DRAFT_391799, partial [Pilaira anomala]
MPSRNTKEKPTVSVTNNSSPEEILHSSWTFINAVQFFNTFKDYFQLPKRLSIDKLETGLLLTEWSTEENNNNTPQTNRESSVLSNTSSQTATEQQPLDNYLVTFLIQIITPLLKPRQRLTLNASTLDQYLSYLLPQHNNPFISLSILDKISLLKDIQDLHLESTDETFVALKGEKSAKDMRIEPLGTDYQGWTYWYFDDTRLYREIPMPTGKRGQNKMNSDYTFQLVCSTEEEWHDLIKTFQPSNRTSNKELSGKLIEIGLNVISKLESRKVAKARNEAKLKRTKELELIPKKRSRRLEVKQDEEAKRQKILEIARQQEELEEYERKEKLKREKQLIEQEQQELLREEAKLRNNVHDFITQIISSGSVPEDLARELGTQLSKRATEQERLNRMQAWIRLSNLDVKLDKNFQDIKFEGNDLNRAVDHVLFKNALRIYLATLMKSDTNTSSNLENVYKKLVLSKYQHLDDFSMDLNHELLLVDDTIKSRALNLLHSVFHTD